MSVSLFWWRIYQIVPIKYDARDEDSIKAAIANSNVIVNCIGRKLLSLPSIE